MYAYVEQLASRNNVKILYLPDAIPVYATHHMKDTKPYLYTAHSNHQFTSQDAENEEEDDDGSGGR